MREIIPGERFTRLTVIKEGAMKNFRVMVECQCDCGNITVKDWINIWRGLTRSCGCLQREYANSHPKKKVYDESKLEPYH